MAPADIQLFSPGVYAATARGRRLVDDRGLIYMRHGEPDARAAYHGALTQTNPDESWQYRTPHGNLLFHFCGSLALGTQAPTTLVEMLPLIPDVLSSRMQLDPRFQQLAGDLRSNSAQILIHDLVRDADHDIRTGLSTDEYAATFNHQIDLLAQFFGVGGGSPNGSRVLAVFALDGKSLTPVPLAQGGFVYPVSLRLIASDAAGRMVRTDTTRYFRTADSLAKGQFLFGLEQLALPPGTWNVSLLVTQPRSDAGGAVGRRQLSIGGRGVLSLSDLVFGRAGSGLEWKSPDGVVALNPLDAYPRKGSAEVYYELSGATAGREYRTDLELKGVSGDARGEVHLGFTEKAAGAVLHLRRSVALDPLKGGQYRMTITVTEEGTGKSVKSERLLNVVK
jgi:hypothetical protein